MEAPLADVAAEQFSDQNRFDVDDGVGGPVAALGSHGDAYWFHTSGRKPAIPIAPVAERLPASKPEEAISWAATLTGMICLHTDPAARIVATSSAGTCATSEMTGPTAVAVSAVAALPTEADSLLNTGCRAY
jgi:hypothetical protein